MWFSSLFARWGTVSPRPSVRRRSAASPRLRVEALEDRTLPSALIPVHHAHVLAGLVRSLDDQQTQSFQVSATFDHTGNKVGTLSGSDAILGSFTGTFTQQQEGAKLTGTFTLDFSSGSVTGSYETRLDRTTNQFVGTYHITSGTDGLADATGTGLIAIDHAGQGNVSLSGTITL
jgi:hypothetical protein